MKGKKITERQDYAFGVEGWPEPLKKRTRILFPQQHLNALLNNCIRNALFIPDSAWFCLSRGVAYFGNMSIKNYNIKAQMLT